MRDCELTSCAAAFRSLVLGRADLPWFPTSRYTRPAATARKLVLRSPYDDSQLAHWPFVVHNLSRLVRRVRAAGRVLARNDGTHAVRGRESGNLYGFGLIIAALILALVYGWACQLPSNSSHEGIDAAGDAA